MNLIPYRESKHTLNNIKAHCTTIIITVKRHHLTSPEYISAGFWLYRYK